MALEDILHPFLGRYMDAPQWLKASAGHAYRWLPTRVRLGDAYPRFSAEAALRGAAATALARDKLQAALAWALETVPAYRAYRGLLAAVRDPLELLARLPVVDKLDIKHDTDAYLSTAMPVAARLETFTGGSTRNPMRFYLEKHVSRSREAAYMRDFRARAGGAGSGLTLSLRGRSVPAAGDPGGALWMLEPIRRQLILSSDHLERRYMPGYMEALARFRPRYIEAFPSALYPLARWLAAHPMPEVTGAVKGVMLYSETTHGFQLDAFRAVFGCPIVMHYGHSERVLMAATMPGDERYFFWPQYGHFELLDAENRPVTQPGRLGFVVGTGFDNRVLPFVRYRTGDLAVLSAEPHPELGGFPACERIVGRLQEFVVCRDQRLVSITTLGVAHFPELAEADAIQYEQHRAGHVVLKVVAHGPLPGAAREAIASAVARKTQGGCDVEVVQVDAIARTPRGKSPMLVQHLDLRRHFGAAAEN